MKYLLIALIAALSFPATAFSAANSGTPYRILYTSQSLAQIYTVVVAQTSRALKGMTVMNTGNLPVWIGTAGAGSAVNTEQSIAIVSASMSVPVYFPVAVSGGYRISIEGTGGIGTGELQLNTFY